MVAKHQLTDGSVYDYRIFFIKDPIANKLFIFLISTIANVMPESMWWLTGDLALPSDTSRLRHNSYRAGMNFKTTCIAGTFFCKRRLLHNYTSFRLEPPSCIICVISLLQIDWQFFPFCYKIPQRFAETSENWEASWYHILTGRTNKSETARQITGLTHTEGQDYLLIVPVKIRFDETFQFSEGSANVSVTMFPSGLQELPKIGRPHDITFWRVELTSRKQHVKYWITNLTHMKEQDGLLIVL